MLKYPCLVLDHDDTVVMSEATVNFPYFEYILGQFRPGVTITRKEYTDGCCYLGFTEMCRERYGFTDAELEAEYLGWKAYVMDHSAAPYAGIRELILRQKELGGKVCVVSHSNEETIRRDYRLHFGVEPDAVFGWDYPEHQRKPNVYPLEQIMQIFGFSAKELLMVDDMMPGCEMAKKAGVEIAFAGWGRRDYPELTADMERSCDYAFQSVDQLGAFLFDR